MQSIQLETTIEQYRSEMISQAMLTSFNDQKVIEISQKLDQLLNEWSIRK
ncbi:MULTISPECIES: aspartyl-phosphate phosphatase Spo0E family protein [unclassified Domibacillus]|nr:MULTISPECIES: aspartyl-phosphate phosphatase Spo0E family protein [unclassified Domibacillus]MCI2255820.1 aspartyl-phosphate phosphatase Spo0E family protein [Domibacillus sp. PGB-M46]